MSKGERSSRLQTFASANKVQERLELQRAIMEDIEAANKTAKTASSSAAINQDEELASDGSTFAANVRIIKTIDCLKVLTFFCSFRILEQCLPS